MIHFCRQRSMGYYHMLYVAPSVYIHKCEKEMKRDMKSIFGHIHTTNLLVHAIDFHYMGYCSPRGYSMVS